MSEIKSDLTLQNQNQIFCFLYAFSYSNYASICSLTHVRILTLFLAILRPFRHVKCLVGIILDENTVCT